MEYCNPIIPGFYPDPSICRVGNDYYLITSSFEFFPGVPLFHSKDLIHWEQIGHVLTRESQLSLGRCQPSQGVWAPTIRYHQSRFYMVTTNMSGKGNFYVWTDNIRGEWSDPIWISQKGIDPSLFFDDDGTVYLLSTIDGAEGQGIGQSVLNLETGTLITEPKLIWYGSGGKYPEGPHLYKWEGLYYLMIAEGGTEYGHMETIARSSSPWGPYESCPNNPILTHRDTTLDQFQALGHADLVDTPEGDLWAVFHGIRTTQYMFHHIGRETMLAPVYRDKDGWPIVNEGKMIEPLMRVPGRLQKANDFCHSEKADFDAADIFQDHFDQKKLAHCWSYLRNPDVTNYTLSSRPSFLGMTASDDFLDDCGSPTFIGKRQQHFFAVAETVMDFSPENETSQAGITVFHTNEHHYDLIVTRKNGRKVILLRKRVGDMVTESAPVYVSEKMPLVLCVNASKLEYTFSAGVLGEPLQLIGRGRTQLLSTECMVSTFTGCFFGLFAQGTGTAWFDSFRYFRTSEGNL